jgi:hypothetical protein
MVGWVDVAMALFAAFLCGGMMAWKFLHGVRRAELLAALEIGRREARRRLAATRTWQGSP